LAVGSAQTGACAKCVTEHHPIGAAAMLHAVPSMLHAPRCSLHRSSQVSHAARCPLAGCALSGSASSVASAVASEIGDCSAPSAVKS
jgi:hypothetical protein